VVNAVRQLLRRAWADDRVGDEFNRDFYSTYIIHFGVPDADPVQSVIEGEAALTVYLDFIEIFVG